MLRPRFPSSHLLHVSHASRSTTIAGSPSHEHSTRASAARCGVASTRALGLNGHTASVTRKGQNSVIPNPKTWLPARIVVILRRPNLKTSGGTAMQETTLYRRNARHVCVCVCVCVCVYVLWCCD